MLPCPANRRKTPSSSCQADFRFHQSGSVLHADWLIVADDAPVAASKSSKVNGGDLLMMETDPQIFRRPLRNRATFAVVRSVDKQQAVFRLSRIWMERDSDASAETLVVDAFDSQGEGQRGDPLTSAHRPPPTVPRRSRIRELRPFPGLGRDLSPGHEQVPATSKPTQGRTITWPDVAGVALALVRNLGLEGRNGPPLTPYAAACKPHSRKFPLATDLAQRKRHLWRRTRFSSNSWRNRICQLA